LKEPSDKTELRNFGLTVGAIVVGLFGILLPWIHHRSFPRWPWVLGAILIASAAAAPRLLRYPFFVWERIGWMLGWVNSRIALNLLFFVIFLPAGVIARLTGWDPLRRRFQPEESSYRIAAVPRDRANMEKPY